MKALFAVLLLVASGVNAAQVTKQDVYDEAMTNVMHGIASNMETVRDSGKAEPSGCALSLQSLKGDINKYEHLPKKEEIRVIRKHLSGAIITCPGGQKEWLQADDALYSMLLN